MTAQGGDIQVPWEDIPDSGLVPDGSYTCRIEDLEMSATGGGEGAKLPAGCLMIRGQFAIDSSNAHAGMMLFDNFVIGTSADPMAKDPVTWTGSIGGRRLKELLKKAVVPMKGTLEQTLRSAKGNMVVLAVTQRTTQRGTPMNNVTRYSAAVGGGGGGPIGGGSPLANPAGATKGATIACPTCDEVVQRDDFGKHMETKHGEG